FFALELGAVFPQAAGGVALMLFAIQSVRLVFWHTPGIWRKPLLWGLYLAVVWFDVGFLLTGWSRLGLFGGLSPFVAVHAFAYGGIGMATLSMMARVSLGHTGRSIHHPPRWTGMMLGLLAMGTGVRVILPALIPSHHLTWVVMSQGLWVAAFGLFLILYGRFLVGREGGGVG
ncbi:MAG: NnrS family protein, partial [Algisphaera sp.]